MKQEMTEKLTRLEQLAQTAQNPKILIEEMRLVAAEAFQIQDDLMASLDEDEAVETDIETVQALFETRESIWDTINQIALREKEVKEHTSSRDAFTKHKEEQKKYAHTDCCCGHHHNNGGNNHQCDYHHDEEHHCSGHNHSDSECCHTEDTDRKCCGKHKCGCHH